MTDATCTEERVLLLAPTPKDASMTTAIFSDIGLPCTVCPSVQELCEQIGVGAGAVVLTEHVLNADQITLLSASLKRQPAWSDLPMVLLIAGGANSLLGRHAMAAFGNVTVLERPIQMATLASVVRTLIRSRQRQYQIREHLREREALLSSERTARGEAERNSRIKDEFLATLSHELRTPLNAILGWAHILTRKYGAGLITDDVHAGLETIERNAKAQAQIIEDLLDMSRIINGKIHLEMKPLNLASVLEASVQTASPAAEAKEISLISRVQTNTSEVVGDANRLQQVFWNLLSNAVKFTPRGGRIIVTLEENDKSFCVSITDSGEGIAEDVIGHVFDRFRQADSSTTRRHGGLGLGLAIVKQLVELHGGTVDVQSAGIGRGSTFVVRMPTTPVTIASGGQQPPRTTLDRKGSRDEPTYANLMLDGVIVVVVDDEPDARFLVKRLLEDSNATVYTAGSAQEALHLIRDKLPQVLVSDIGMPNEDGYLLIQKVRAMEEGSGHFTPALALTAYARQEDKDRAIRYGFQRHIVKPVQPSELLTSVAALLKVDGQDLQTRSTETVGERSRASA